MKKKQEKNKIREKTEQTSVDVRFFSRSEDVELARFAAFASGEMFQTRMLLRCGKKGTTTRKVRTTRRKSFEIRRPRKEREKGGRNAKNSRVINIDEFIFSREKQTTDNKIRLSAERQKKKNKRKRERKKGKSHEYIIYPKQKKFLTRGMYSSTSRGSVSFVNAKLREPKQKKRKIRRFVHH